MKFLIDTNILIPAEPQALPRDAGSLAVMELMRLVSESRNQVLVHPLIRADIARDGNDSRRSWTTASVSKYPTLDDFPRVSESHRASLGAAEVESNDWVDDHLVVAVERDAVDYLVTEDKGVHAKGRRLGIGNRVLRVIDAMTVVRGLFPKFGPPPPAVHKISACQLDERDPVFDGLREDYPAFDKWLAKAKRDGRPTWAIRGTRDQLAAVCIINEQGGEYGLSGKLLKICTFKVGDAYHGFRFGELLLKPVFRYAMDNRCDWVFVSAFDKHEHLFELFGDLGFRVLDVTTSLGERILARRVVPSPEEEAALAPDLFCSAYAPTTPCWSSTAWLVPIQPKYDRLLFPERVSQLDIFTGQHPFGNALRKAYLCRSKANSVRAGDLLAFYRSHDHKSVVALGTVDGVLRSADARLISRFVARRTVYCEKAIDAMCDKGEVLAVLFHQVLRDFNEIGCGELANAGINVSQSLSRIPEEAKPWLRQRTGT